MGSQVGTVEFASREFGGYSGKGNYLDCIHREQLSQLVEFQPVLAPIYGGAWPSGYSQTT